MNGGTIVTRFTSNGLRAELVVAPLPSDAKLRKRGRRDERVWAQALALGVVEAHHSSVALLIALDHLDALGAQHAAVATLTGSASAARVAAPHVGVGPLLTAGRSVRGPGLLGDLTE